MANHSPERMKIRDQIKAITKKGSWSCHGIAHALFKQLSDQSKPPFDRLIVEVKNITALLLRYGYLKREDSKRVCEFSNKKVYFYRMNPDISKSDPMLDQNVIWQHQYIPPTNLNLTRPNTWLSSLGVAA